MNNSDLVNNLDRTQADMAMTDAQRARIEEIMRGSAERHRELARTAAQLRRELRVAVENETTSEAEFTGDVDSPFCVAGRQVDELQQTPPNPLDSDSYRAAVEGTLELMPELVANAPAELADDLPLAQAYFESVHAAFADAGFDVLAVEFGTIPDDPATRAARDRIEDYMEQVCGVPADDDDDDDDELPTEGTMRDYLIAQFTEAGNTVEQADCMIEFMRTNSTDGDSQALGFALIRECGLTSQWVASGFTQEQADCMVAELRKLPEDVSDAEMEAALVGGCGLDD